MSHRALVAVAWINVAIHLIGLILAAVGMRPGSPLASLSDRLDYLAQSPFAWTAGWATWMLCAVALIVFLAMIVRRLGDVPLARIALTIAIVAAAFDLLCDAIHILVLPMLARMGPASQPLFLVIERIAGIASLFIANGGYSVAILLIAESLRRQVSRLTTALGFAVGGFGLLLAGAGFTGDPNHAQWLTPPTIGLFCVWCPLVARSLREQPT